MCEICDLIAKKDSVLLDEKDFVVALSPTPATMGHMLIAPKAHIPIIESVPDSLVGSMFVAANKVSMLVFEKLGAQGTNILVNNGVPAGQTIPHFFISVIPRKENDSINLAWQPKQATPEEIESAFEAISTATKNVGVFEEEKKEPEHIDSEPEQIDASEESLQIKNLDRIP